MNYEREHLAAKDVDESTPAYELPYEHPKSFKLIVEFCMASPVPRKFLERWFFRSFPLVEAVITVPEGATVEDALQKAIHNIPDPYSSADFTRALVFCEHFQRQGPETRPGARKRILVTDRLGDASTIFEDGPMIISNDPDYFKERSSQVARWLLLVFVCFVLAITMLILATK